MEEMIMPVVETNETVETVENNKTAFNKRDIAIGVVAGAAIVPAVYALVKAIQNAIKVYSTKQEAKKIVQERFGDRIEQIANDLANEVTENTEDLKEEEDE